MKIAVTSEQPIDEIFGELVRLGYLKTRDSKDGPMWVVCYDGGFYHEALRVIPLVFELTTLAQLKKIEAGKRLEGV